MILVIVITCILLGIIALLYYYSCIRSVDRKVAEVVAEVLNEPLTFEGVRGFFIDKKSDRLVKFTSGKYTIFPFASIISVVPIEAVIENKKEFGLVLETAIDEFNKINVWFATELQRNSAIKMIEERGGEFNKSFDLSDYVQREIIFKRVSVAPYLITSIIIIGFSYVIYQARVEFNKPMPIKEFSELVSLIHNDSELSNSVCYESKSIAFSNLENLFPEWYKQEYRRRLTSADQREVSKQNQEFFEQGAISTNNTIHQTMRGVSREIYDLVFSSLSSCRYAHTQDYMRVSIVNVRLPGSFNKINVDYRTVLHNVNNKDNNSVMRYLKISKSDVAKE